MTEIDLTNVYGAIGLASAVPLSCVGKTAVSGLVGYFGASGLARLAGVNPRTAAITGLAVEGLAIVGTALTSRSCKS